MADETREILDKLLAEVKRQIAKAPPSKKGSGPTFQVNLQVTAPKASGNIASRAAAKASGTPIAEAGTTLRNSGPSGNRGDFFSQEARRGGFFSSVNPVTNFVRSKRDVAFGQFGQPGRMAQHYLDLIGQGQDRFGNPTGAAKLAQGVQSGLSVAGATLNVAANDVGPLAAAIAGFLKGPEGASALGEAIAGYFHTYAQQARNLIAEVTSPLKAAGDVNEIRKERMRAGQGNEDLSDLSDIYAGARNREAGLAKMQGLAGANQSEAEWRAFMANPEKHMKFIIDLIGREVEQQFKNFIGNFKI